MANYLGDENDNTFAGDATDELIEGLGGNDTLSGGMDTILGGDGDDTIQLANGDFVTGETLDGGPGRCTAVGQRPGHRHDQEPERQCQPDDLGDGAGQPGAGLQFYFRAGPAVRLHAEPDLRLCLLVVGPGHWRDGQPAEGGVGDLGGDIFQRGEHQRRHRGR